MTSVLRDRANLVPGAYRGVAVATVDTDLSEESLRSWFMGREVYRRTRFVVVHDRGGQTAVLSVVKATEEPLFSPVTAVDMLSGPLETSFVSAPDADTAVPSELARVAAQDAPGARAVVVRGRYEHVSFIVNPEPITLVVQEIVPPGPAKLIDQVRRILSLAEDLPPFVVVPDEVTFTDLAQNAPADRYLMPCRGSGAAVDDAAVDYLDERPARQDWILLGCSRSREIHRWFYGDEPASVETCPRRRPHDEARPTLTKCCLLESSNDRDGHRLVVPWGASLDQVKAALHDLAEMWAPAWQAV